MATRVHCYKSSRGNLHDAEIAALDEDMEYAIELWRDANDSFEMRNAVHELRAASLALVEYHAR